MKKTLILIVFIGSLASAAFATPSTLVWIPSTDIQPTGVMRWGSDFYGRKALKPLYVHGLTFGTDKFEYGVDYVTFSGSSATWLHGKMTLLEEKDKAPKVVIGAYNVGKSEDASPNFLYILGSKSTEAARFHAGIATGRKSVLGDDNAMLLLGIDKTFNDKWWGAIDYQGGKSAYGALSAGVAYNFSPNTSLIVGRDFYNDKSLDDTWTVQIDVNY